jgi:hypothetical protein
LSGSRLRERARQRLVRDGGSPPFRRPVAPVVVGRYEPFGIAACPLGGVSSCASTCCHCAASALSAASLAFCTRRCAGRRVGWEWTGRGRLSGSGLTAAGKVREEDRQGARAVVVDGIRRQGSAAPLQLLWVSRTSCKRRLGWPHRAVRVGRILTCSSCLCVRACVRLCGVRSVCVSVR